MRTAAAIFAIVTLLVTGAAFHAVAHTRAVSERQPLDRFPLRMGAWEGHTAFFSPDVVAALHADDYLLRAYQTASTRGLWLYVAYYGSQPLDSRIHSPAVCLPGAGWQIATTGTTRILVGRQAITVNSNVIQKGDDRQLVLYWYQIHGRVVAREVQAMETLAWTALTQRTSDEALVRINAPIVGSVGRTLAQETSFVQTAFPQLGRFLP
jgi:EpsI family protein